MLSWRLSDSRLAPWSGRPGDDCRSCRFPAPDSATECPKCGTSLTGPDDDGVTRLRAQDSGDEGVTRPPLPFQSVESLAGLPNDLGETTWRNEPPTTAGSETPDSAATRGRLPWASRSARAITSSRWSASAAWAPSTRPGTPNSTWSSRLKVIRPEVAADPRGGAQPRAAVQARAAARPPGHAQQRRAHPRPGRDRRREVHHACRSSRARTSRRSCRTTRSLPSTRTLRIARTALSGLVAAHQAGRRPPRPQAGQPHDRPRATTPSSWTSASRARRARRTAIGRRPTVRRRNGSGDAGRTHGRADRRDHRVHGARAGTRRRRSTSAPTSTRSA